MSVITIIDIMNSTNPARPIRARAHLVGRGVDWTRGSNVPTRDRIVRRCKSCKHAQVKWQRKKRSSGFGGKRLIVGCELGHDVVSEAECFDIVRRRINSRKCTRCGERSRDWELWRGNALCRECFVGDYTPSYEPHCASSVARMEEHAIGTEINWALLNQRMAAAMKKMRIPRIDRFGSQRLKKDL